MDPVDITYPTDVYHTESTSRDLDSATAAFNDCYNKACQNYSHVEGAINDKGDWYVNGHNDVDPNPSHDSTNTNVDDSRQAEQDFAYSSKQEDAAHGHRTEKDRQSPSSETTSTPSTRSNQSNKPLSHENKTFNKPYVDPVKELEENLQSPEYRKQLEDYKDGLQKTLDKPGADKQTVEKQIHIIKSILDGSMCRWLNQLKNWSLESAIDQFRFLKCIFPWKAKTSYLVDQPTAEQKAFNDIVGIDIMQAAESIIVGRVDYLELNRTSPEVMEYFIKTTLKPMQLQGNKKGLEQFKAEQILQIKKNNNLQAKAAVVATNSLLSDPLTLIFDNIKNADIATARKELGSFQMQILHHIETQNLKNMDEARADMMEREGADILEAANKCFESRPDYPSYQEKMAQKTANTSQNTNNTNSNNQDTKTNNQRDNADPNNIDNNSASKNNASKSNHDHYGIYPTFEDENTTTASSTQKNTVDNAAKKQDVQNNLYPLPQKKQNTNPSEERKNARNLAHRANPTARRKQKYVLNPDVWARLHTYHINPEQFTSCVGNEVQQQIHSECVSILNETTHIPSNASTQPLIDMTITFVFVGNVSSQQNNTEQAFSLTDCAWAALNCAKSLCEKGIDIAKTGTVEIAKGVAHGLHNAVQNNVNMVMDPIGTVTNIAHTFGNLAYCVYKATEPLMIYDEEMGANEETISRVNEEWLENMHSVIAAAKGVTLQGAVAFATESLVSPKITKMGFGILSHYAQKPITQLVKVAKETKDKVVDKAQKIVKAARNVIDKTDNPAPQYIYATTNTGKVIKIPMPVEIEETADTLYNTMGKNGNNHNKKPTFNDIKNEIAKTKIPNNTSKGSVLNKADWQPMTAKQAREAARKLGFEETNYFSDGRPVFKRAWNEYITPDRTGHNGGAWKMANSVKELQTDRLGTYDINLKRIGD